CLKCDDCVTRSSRTAKCMIAAAGPPHTAPPWSLPGPLDGGADRRPDVLVVGEGVVRVVGVFERDEALVLRVAEAGAGAFLRRLGGEVEIDAAGRIRAHRLREAAHPADVLLVVRLLRPMADRVQHEPCVAVAE